MSSFYIFILPFSTFSNESFVWNKINSSSLTHTWNFREKNGKISKRIIQTLTAWILHRHAENLHLSTW